MKTTLVLHVQQVKVWNMLLAWLKRKNELFTILIDEEDISNGKSLVITSAMLSGCFLIFSSSALLLSPSIGYMTIVICLLCFLLSLLLCWKIK